MALVAGEKKVKVRVPSGAAVSQIAGEVADELGPEARRIIFDQRGEMRLAALVNGRHVESERQVAEGDTVAFIVPVYGGTHNTEAEPYSDAFIPREGR